MATCKCAATLQWAGEFRGDVATEFSDLVLETTFGLNEVINLTVGDETCQALYGQTRVCRLSLVVDGRFRGTLLAAVATTEVKRVQRRRQPLSLYTDTNSLLRIR